MFNRHLKIVRACSAMVFGSTVSTESRGLSVCIFLMDLSIAQSSEGHARTCSIISSNQLRFPIPSS